jgi:periplasmic divalent cation tolerance protein
LARKTVENRLAACVQFTSIDSIYRWKGAVESASEYVLLAKTRSDLADDLVSFIRANHSYEVPEITVMPIAGGLPEYLSWISDETAK